MVLANSSLAQKYDERATVYRECESMLAQMRVEARDMTSTEIEAYDGKLARVKALTTEIEVLNRQREEERAGFARQPVQAWQRGGVGNGRPDEGFAPRAMSPRMADMFPQIAHDLAGFASADEFVHVVGSQLYHPSLQASLGYGDASGGGYLAPPQFAMQTFDMALASEIVRPRAKPYPMTSDSLTVAGFTHGNGTTGPFGVLGGWTAPGANITQDTPNVRAVHLQAHKLAVLANTINELLADSNYASAELGSILSKSLSWQLDNAFFTGTGAGEPLGILNAPATVTQAKEGGQAADTIVTANILKMYSRFLPSSFANGVWVANASTVPQLLAATLAPNQLLVSQQGNSFFMLGLPILFTERVPVLGDLGDVMLCDFSAYAVGLRADLVIERSNDLGFQNDTAWFRAKLRADGQPLLDAPYTPLNGPTQSTFVMLEAR